MAFPTIDEGNPGVPIKDPRRARRNPGQGARALMEETPDNVEPEIKEPWRLYDKGAGTITPGPNTGPAIQVSSSQIRTVSEDILKSLNLI
jgi:hypothetical protein